MLTHCLLSWAKQRAPICPLCTVCRSLGSQIAPKLAASFLASFDALVRERKGASGAWWGSTKDQTAPEGARLLCWALRPTTGITHILASGCAVVKNTRKKTLGGGVGLVDENVISPTNEARLQNMQCLQDVDPPITTHNALHCWALRPTTGVTHILASGCTVFKNARKRTLGGGEDLVGEDAISPTNEVRHQNMQCLQGADPPFTTRDVI